MKLRLCSILLCVASLFSLCFAQDTNIFISRDYWKTNPSIADIDKQITAGQDISELNLNAFDAVTYALIEKVDNETVKYLLSKKGNGVNKLTHDGRTYIFWAAYKNNLEMMQYLVDYGAKTDIVDSHGYTVLNFAATTGQTNTKLYDFLIKYGADPTTETNHKGANALLLVAPFLKDCKLVDYFLSKNVSIDVTDNNGNGIFNYAAKGGNIKFLESLIKNGLPYQNLNSQGGNAMIFASQGLRRHNNTLEVYEFLKEKGVSPNITGEDGKNPLHNIAFENKDIELYKFFIESGVNINDQDDNGNSVFMNASDRNTLEVVKFLSQYVKDINATNKDGRSALALAVRRNDIEVVNFLLENGAKVYANDINGNSLAYDLLNSYKINDTSSFEAKLKLLTEAGFDISKTQGQDKTLYHFAVEKNNLDLLKRVVKFNIDINAKNKDGLTPLHLAAMKASNEDLIKYLISIGADKTIKTDFEESVYDLASENELLQKNSIDINFLK